MAIVLIISVNGKKSFCRQILSIKNEAVLRENFLSYSSSADVINLTQKFACGKILSTIYLCVTMLLIKLQISRESSTEKISIIIIIL